MTWTVNETTTNQMADDFNKLNNFNYLNNKICLCGDSITDDSYGSNAWIDWGWGSWFKRSLNSNYTLDSQDIFAVASMGTAHLLSTQLPQVLSSGNGICITMIGTNDLGSAVDIVANLETFYNELSQNGVFAVAMPILPHSSPDSYSAQLAAEASRVNKYLRDRAVNNKDFIYLSALDVFTDYSTGDAISDLLRDGIHTTKLGGSVLGLEIASKFNKYKDAGYVNGFEISGNQYDATENPNGNIVDNPYMTGTGGILQNGATGVVADGLAFRRSSPSATFGLVGSIETINNKNYQVATISGTGDGNLVTIVFAVSSIPASWVENDIINGGMTIISDGLSGVGYMSVRVNIDSIDVYDGINSGSNGGMPTDYTLNYSSKLSCPSSAVSGFVRVDVQTISGQPLAGEFKISDLFMIKES